jgi:hypothetical protein
LSRLSPAFVLGYHGCDASVAGRVFKGESLRPSANDYDWLGKGVYFWEADPERALQWAEEWRDRGKIKEPAIVGAVIDLRNCLNLATQDAAMIVKDAFQTYRRIRRAEGKDLAENENPRGHSGEDRLLRKLDNAVIEQVHSIVSDTPGFEPFDTVRAMFREGEPIYPDAGFWEKTHVQIAVRNLDCVIGYFRLRKPRG